MVKKWKQYLKDESGVSLIVAIMTLFVLSIIGVTLATVTFANIKLSTTDREFQSAYYIAEAGVNQAYAEIRDVVMESYESTNNSNDFFTGIYSDVISDTSDINHSILDSFKSSFGKQPEAYISVIQLDEENPRTYQISSEGRIGERKRTVTKEFTVNWTPKTQSFVPRVAAIIKNKIELNSGAKVMGNVYITTSDSEAIKFSNGGKITDGELYVPTNNPLGELENTNYYHEELDFEFFENIVNSIPEAPHITNVISDIHHTSNVKKDIVVENDSVINNFFLGNGTLSIDTKGKTVNLIVNNLDLDWGGSHIELKGDGILNIYIKNRLKLVGGSTINKSGNSNNLNLYYSGSSPLEFANNVTVNATLYNKSAPIDFQGGQVFIGNVFSQSKKIYVKNNAQVTGLFIAPYSDMEITGGSTIKGTLIANKLDGNDTGTIKYENLPSPDFPIDNEDSNGGNGGEDTDDDLITPGPNIE